MTRSIADDPARYGGDSRLAELLAAERAGKSVADMRGIVAGVLAAPEDVEGDLWLSLVVAQASDELKDQLQALKASMASRTVYGLDAPPPAPAWRLKALRGELERLGLDGFIVPHADEHQGEILAMRSERLNWLAGFGGSAGVAVVLKEKAAVGHIYDRAKTGKLNHQLADISAAVPVLDGAGWHLSNDLETPSNISLLRLPPYILQFNPIEKVFAFLKGIFHTILVYSTFDELRSVITNEWKRFLSGPDRIKSITSRGRAACTR